MEIREFETRVIDVIQRTHDIKSFRFAVPEDIEFKPGQFFFVTIKIKDQDVTKHFSFSNSPTEKGYVEFTKRITGSEFSQALNQLKKGDWARLKMPFGNFTFEGEYEKIAFLTGGVGVTCIRSMCKFACDKRLSTDIILLYGNSTKDDIAFREDFDQMQAENKNLRVVHTLTSPGVDRSVWKGRTGFIDSKMVKEEIPDYKERIFYISGPPKMVDTLRAILSEELKLDKERIKWENFSGY
jgi:ferredoxin-NADP reductase